MRFRILAPVALPFLLLVSSAFAQVLPASYPPLGGNPVLEHDLLSIVNAARQAEGLGRLEPDEALTLAARHHAEEMAKLGYFSHDSPTPQNRSPLERAARAGSPLATLAENLASVPDEDVAETALAGWLASPGHQANLLQQDMTHVGYGTASDPYGNILVVQLLGRQPFSLAAASVSAGLETSYMVNVETILSEAAEVIFAYGGVTAGPFDLGPGRERLRLELPSGEPLHLQAATRAPEGDGFILQDSGWLEPAAERFEPDSPAPQGVLQLGRVEVLSEERGVYLVELHLENPQGLPLAVFVGDVYQPEAVLSDSEVRVSVPAGLELPTLALGIREGSRVEVIMTFDVELSLGRARLTPG